MTFIGIDIGTTSVCGVKFEFGDRKLDAVTHRNSASLNSPHEWEKIQDPDKLLSLVLEILKDFYLSYEHVYGIGITGEMHGILYVDENGNSAGPLYTWEDKRGDQIFQEGQSYAGYLSDITGYNVASGFGLVTHFYNLKNGLVPKKAHRLCTIMDYIVMKLSGRKTPLIDYTNSSQSGFF